MNKNKSLFSFGIVAGLTFHLLTGCSPLNPVTGGAENVTNTVQPTVLPSNTKTLPATQEVIETDAPTPTVTVRPTMELTPTKILKRTITPIPLPTRTPYPNLFSETTVNYRLDKFLTEFGEPQEVYIDTYPYSPEPPSLPFYLILYYPDVGISAFFEYNAVNLDDEILRVCPLGQPVSPEVIMWNPEEHLTIDDLYPWISTLRYPFLTLSEATGMNIGSFTEEFQKSNCTKCIDVPVDLY